MPEEDKQSKISWATVREGAVTPVHPDHSQEAVERLGERNPVKITAQYAQRLTGLPLKALKGEAFLLARAGLIVWPELSTKDLIRNAEDRLSFAAVISPDNRELLVYTRQMSAAFPSRKFAVVAQVPATVVYADSQCLYHR